NFRKPPWYVERMPGGVGGGNREEPAYPIALGIRPRRRKRQTSGKGRLCLSDEERQGLQPAGGAHRGGWAGRGQPGPKPWRPPGGGCHSSPPPGARGRRGAVACRK